MKRRRRFLAGGQQTNLLLLGGRSFFGVLLSLSFPPFLPVCMHWWAERKGIGGNERPFFSSGLGGDDWDARFAGFVLKKSTKKNFTCETVFSSLLVYLVGDSCAFFHFLDGGRATWRVFLFGERRKRKKQCLSLRTNLFIPIFLSHKPKREPTEIFERDFSSLSLWERDLRLKERGRRKNCWMAVGTNYGSLDVINTLLFPLRTFFLFFLFIFFLLTSHHGLFLPPFSRAKGKKVPGGLRPGGLRPGGLRPGGLRPWGIEPT